MSRTFRFTAGLVALLVVVALAVPAVAQEQRSSIIGTVKGTDGGTLPGVRVDVKGANLPGGASTVSNADGRYRFPALPPGVYEVSATLQGFQQKKFSSVSLQLGQTLEVDFTLQLGKTEQITVTSEAPLIDTKASSVSTNIQAAQVAKLPKGRDFSSVVQQAAGTWVDSRAGGISIDGASGSENVFYIDGQNTTNLQNGVQGKQLVVDFIQETQVKSTGYPAEYGGAMGGVVNVVTKSGSNEWKGEVDVYYSASSLDGSPNKTLRLNPTDNNAAQQWEYPKDSYNRWDPGFQIGGPIVKDKLFFFLGYQPYFYSVDRDTTMSTSAGPTAVNTYNQKQTMNYGVGNINWQISPSINARVAATFNPWKRTNVLPAQDGSTSSAAPLDIDQNQPNTNVSGTIDWIANQNLYFGARGGWFQYNTYDTGVPTDPRVLFQRSNVGMAGIPAEYQRQVGYSNITSNNAITRDIQSRTSAAVDGTIFFSGWGQHNLKAGWQFDHLTNDVYSGEQANLYELYWGASSGGKKGTYGYYRNRQFQTTGNISSDLNALFAQDTWTISNRVTLNLGIRFESENVPSYNGAPTIKFGFGDKIAPRVGVAWDLFGNGQSKLYASWGWFYDNIKLEMPRGSFGGDKWIRWIWTLDTYDWTIFTKPIPGCDNLNVATPIKTCPGTYISQVDLRAPSNNPEDNLIDPNLAPMKSQEFTVGFDQELGKFMAAGIRYVHKNVIKVIEDVGVYNGVAENYFIANPGFGLAEYTLGTDFPAQPEAKRDYDAVELRLEKRYANNWYLRFSYTWSRLWGNYPGLASADETSTGTARTSPNVNRLFDALVMSFDGSGQPVYGNLPTDKTHQFKLNGIYDFPWNMTLGANFYMSSGTPVSTSVGIQSGVEYPVFVYGRGDLGRSSWYNQTDLFLAQRFKLGNSFTVELNATALNLFDQRNVLQYWGGGTGNTTNRGGSAVNITDEQFFAGQLPALYAQQVASGQVQLDPRRLQASLYQAPRTIRFGIKFMF
ncbi:MAG TPA: TonB-dependent receptor [Thermoanaerobaculia bacterium]|nr:TonB-dependent receptor [Thermoanaerobaculia bacterium]HQR66786.1 TonB-dependent receptor [Thermoanaerobaculia bacterium]